LYGSYIPVLSFQTYKLVELVILGFGYHDTSPYGVISAKYVSLLKSGRRLSKGLNVIFSEYFNTDFSP
jgi:hypothetical protein